MNAQELAKELEICSKLKCSYCNFNGNCDELITNAAKWVLEADKREQLLNKRINELIAKATGAEIRYKNIFEKLNELNKENIKLKKEKNAELNMVNLLRIELDKSEHAPTRFRYIYCPECGTKLR